MKRANFITIQEKDVLKKNFEDIFALIRGIATDMDKLIEARNSWEVLFFHGYDDDSWEFLMIPKALNWIRESLNAGIPWFYFMNPDPDCMGLRAFVITCCAEPDPYHPERWLLEKEQLKRFVEKNIDNLEKFANLYKIPEDVVMAAADAVMKLVLDMASGKYDEKENRIETDEEDFEARDFELKEFDLDDEGEEEPMADEDGMKAEAMSRLCELEKLYGLNPKVREYFGEGRLYYSYLAGGGSIGSIDSINYDKKYAEFVGFFERMTGALVYHAIEHQDTLSLLFVSKNPSHWTEERPSSDGILALEADVEYYANRRGFIKLDMLQGVLRRRDGKVYDSLADNVAQSDAYVVDSDKMTVTVERSRYRMV